MDWYIVIPLIYLTVIYLFSVYCARNTVAGVTAGCLIGLLIGPLISLTVGISLQISFGPELREFDTLILLLYFIPIGALLGVFSGIAVSLHLAEVGRCARLISLFGGLPVFAFALWNLVELFRPELQIGREKDTLFWFLANLFPLMWILILWYWSERRYTGRGK